VLFRSETDTCILPIKYTAGKKVSIRCAYPSFEECEYAWNDVNKSMTVKLPKEFTARLFEIILR